MTDYYPFGSVLRQYKLNNTEDYRFGYQGQFSEEDDETGWNAFELRNYDAVVGRWLSVDPVRQYFSPFLSMGNNPVSRVDPDGGTDDWIPKVDKNGNTYYVAEAGDNIQTFMEQFSVSYEDALSYFGNSGYSGVEGSFSLSSIKEGSIVMAPFLQYNLRQNEGGWFAFDYWSKKTQQRAIDHVLFAIEYANKNGINQVPLGKLFTYNTADLGGNTGFRFSGNATLDNIRVPVLIEATLSKHSIIDVSPHPNPVHNDQYINFEFNRPDKNFGQYLMYIQIPSNYSEQAYDFFYK
ncbi:MAG: RHS repeat-associated core domain-containing protein [Cyclobacteriaceae bacterium]|nr:RHS repeat-associated core domain-containing protein [Cyclobacteriaceae bacterium]